MPACPQCLAPLPDDAPAGLCPACLLQRGLEGNTIPGATSPPIENQKSRIENPHAAWTPPSLDELAPFFPDLDLLEFLGRGGMGAVYKARQKSLDRIVALKILPPAIGQGAAGMRFAARFTQEAQAMARLNHPHIVAIYEFGTRTPDSLISSVPSFLNAPLYFFLMEFVDGLTLRQLIRAGTLAPKDALAIVPQICDALQYAHDRGIVHRDIKPENILLARGGQIKIADFGLAKLIGRTKPQSLRAASDASGEGASALMTQDTSLLTQPAGTPDYMAPEQSAAPASVDHRADIYALGVVFYQMLTGELPSDTGSLVPPSRKVQIDVRLDEIVLRALEKSPALRYQNATEFKTEVETVLSSPVPSGSFSPNSPAPRSSAPSEIPNLKSEIPQPSVSAISQYPRAFEYLRIAALLMGIVAAVNMLLSFLSILVSPLGAFILPVRMLGHGFGNLFGVVPWVVAIPLNLFILISAIRMARRRSYARAVASCFLMLLAFPGNILGLPVAIWAFTLLIRPDLRSDFDRPAGGIRTPAAVQRLSLTALLGAICSAFLFIALAALIRQNLIIERVSDFQYFDSLPEMQSAYFPPLIGYYALYTLGAISLFATPICGIVAITRIRRSPATLKGLPLALYDLLVVPLFALDALIWLVLYAIMAYIMALQNIRAQFGQGAQMRAGLLGIWLGTLILSAIVDTAIVWIAWLIVRPAAKKGPTPAVTTDAPVSRVQDVLPRPSQSPATKSFPFKPPLTTAAFHACLLVLSLGFFVFLVPRRVELYRNIGAALPAATELTIRFSRLVQEWFCLVAPAILAWTAGLPFLAQYLGGHLLLRLYSFSFTGILAGITLLAGTTLLLPTTTTSASDAGYLRDAIGDALLAEGYASDPILVHVAPDGKTANVIPGLVLLQGETRADGITPVNGSLELVRFQPGLWDVTGKGALSAFHIAVHTPAHRGMGPAPTFPQPPTKASGVLHAARQTSDRTQAIALLRQAHTLQWLGLGDATDFTDIERLAIELQTPRPTDAPTIEDLDAVGARHQENSLFIRRDLKIDEPFIFYYFANYPDDLIAVVLRMTRNGSTGNIVLSYVSHSANSASGTIVPQYPTPPLSNGHWSAKISDMAGRDILATRIAPARYRIAVMPLTASHPSEAAIMGNWQAPMAFNSGGEGSMISTRSLNFGPANQLKMIAPRQAPDSGVLVEELNGTWTLHDRIVSIKLPYVHPNESLDFVWVDGTLVECIPYDPTERQGHTAPGARYRKIDLTPEVPRRPQ